MCHCLLQRVAKLYGLSAMIKVEPLTRMQVYITPSVVYVDASIHPHMLAVNLTQQPSQPVMLTWSVPMAWDGAPLCDVSQTTMWFSPTDYGTAQRIVIQPRQACEGDYYISLTIT